MNEDQKNNGVGVEMKNLVVQKDKVGAIAQEDDPYNDDGPKIDVDDVADAITIAPINTLIRKYMD